MDAVIVLLILLFVLLAIGVPVGFAIGGATMISMFFFSDLNMKARYQIIMQWWKRSFPILEST